MFFGKYYYQMRIFDSYSLKDKRKVRKSIIIKVQNKFKVSIAEVGDQEIYNSLCIACASVASSYEIIEKTFNGIRNFIEANYDVEIYESFYEGY